MQGPAVCFGMEFGLKGFMGIYSPPARPGWRRPLVTAIQSSCASSRKVQHHMDAIEVSWSPGIMGMHREK